MTVLLFPQQSTVTASNSTVRAWTYADLKSRVADWATRADVTTLVPTFIDYAHQEICRRLRASLNSFTADLTINAESVAIPDDFLAIRRLYLDTTPRRIVSVVSAEERADLTALLPASDYPTHASIEGASIVFAPVFTGSPTGKLLYWGVISGLSADTDTNVVLTKYPFLYLYGALAELYRYTEDDNASDRYQVKFDALISDINRQEASDALAGAIQPQASGAVI